MKYVYKTFKIIFFWVLLRAILKKLINPQHKKIKNVKDGNICIVPYSYSGLGDLIMLNYIIQQLQGTYTVIYGISFSFYRKNKVFLKNHSLTNDFLILPNSKWKWIKFIFIIRKKKIKAVIFDIHPFISSSIFYLGKVPVLICQKDTKSAFFTQEYHYDQSSIHFTDMANMIFELLGNEKKEKKNSIFFPIRKIEIDQLKNMEGISISIHVGGSDYMMKKWSTKNYLELCKLFLSTYNGNIFLVGGKEEYLENEKIKDTLTENSIFNGRVLNFCGMDLNYIANVISLSDVFIGNDSGPMHLANALHKRVIAIFGPSAINAVNPTKCNEKNITIKKNLYCVPCLSAECRLPQEVKYMCLNELPTKIVWANLEKVIGDFNEPFLSDKTLNHSILSKFSNYVS